MGLMALWLKDGIGGAFRSSIPRELITGTGSDPRPRLRVDPEQTGFFEGRMFRGYYEFNVPASSSVALRFVSPIDFIIHGQRFDVDAGFLRYSSATGGTEGGTFIAFTPIGMNRMSERPSPVYTTQVTIGVGGTHTGGTELDVFRLKSSGNSQQASTIGGEATLTRGLPAGTYYVRLQNLDNSTAMTGVYSLEWEERVASSTEIQR